MKAEREAVKLRESRLWWKVVIETAMQTFIYTEEI